MPLKHWYRVVTPREDLAQGKPLDAAEFAVHLDDVRLDRAPADYQTPERFFDRTYLTKNLTSFAAEVVRRLSGEKTETPAVFNMATAFGGGKTHALTLLYHLATHGEQANRWTGVSQLPPGQRQEVVSTIMSPEFQALRIKQTLKDIGAPEPLLTALKPLLDDQKFVQAAELMGWEAESIALHEARKDP
jgi:hypothetical protein